jgi:LacI family transcriptional regulator
MTSPRLAHPHVALLIETSKAFGRGQLQGVARFVRTNGPWSIYVDEYGPHTKLPTWLKGWQGHGIIIRARNHETIEQVKRVGVPVVDTLQQIACDGVAGVYTDDAAIARLAAEHLLERQIRHFAFVGVEKSNWSRRRRDAFNEALRIAGYGCHNYSPISRRRFKESWEGGQEDLAEWLQELPKPVGLFAAHDLRALCVLDACRRVGIAVPEQMAIVGVDNDDVMCNMADPPLTSVAHRSEQLGYEAAALLEHLMNGGAPPAEPILIPPQSLITRRSTDIVAIDDPIIASALQFVRSCGGVGIDVEAVARHVGLSRRALERGFSRYVGRTPHEHISIEQLKRIKQLLQDTDYTLETIATKVGISSAAYLSVFFKERTGQTPGEFRHEARSIEAGDGFFPGG